MTLDQAKAELNRLTQEEQDLWHRYRKLEEEEKNIPPDLTPSQIANNLWYAKRQELDAFKSGIAIMEKSL